MTAVPRYHKGRILWARLRSITGKRELHPAIIISSDAHIIQPEDYDPRQSLDRVNAVAVVGVSTEFAKYPPFVRLPFAPGRGGHSVTKLTQACGACIGWYDWVVLEDDVEFCGGEVPPAIVHHIMTAATEDLKKKLIARFGKLSDDLREIDEMLALLIGEP